MNAAPAVVTIVAGRHDHLRRQRRALSTGARPGVHVVVSMGDPEVEGVLALEADLPTEVVRVDAGDRLPLALARNAGVEAAAALGHGCVVLLDVDCIPEPQLVSDYADLLPVSHAGGPHVVTGRVRYLPEGVPEEQHHLEHMLKVGRDHPARVVPDRDLEPGDPRLLWSLNVALTLADWERIGGFDEAYVGYGGEDTDFGQRLASAGGTLWFTSRAGAFHQWHPTSSPPVQHVADIVANANLFHAKWGWYPMEGWLEQFRMRGLVSLDEHGWRCRQA